MKFLLSLAAPEKVVLGSQIPLHVSLVSSDGDNVTFNEFSIKVLVGE